MDHVSLETVEAGIRGLERYMGISVTVIDDSGIFRDHEGRPLLGYERQSHKKQSVCRLGFCDLCIEHCRYAMNEQGSRQKRPFVHSCWKGVVEIVVPLFFDEVHVGSFFAGAWRSTEFEAVDDGEGERPVWQDALELLPAFDMRIMEEMVPNLLVFCKGMLNIVEDLLHVERAANPRDALIQRFFRLHYADSSVSLQDLADLIGLSPSRTCHVLQERFGKSFRELLLQERMNAARYLLMTSDDTLAQISQKVGIEDEFYFNRLFRRWFGVPPGRYRRQFGGGRKVQ